MFLDSVGQVTRDFCKGSPCWSPKRRTKTNTSHHLVGPLELDNTKTKQARSRTRKTSHLVGFLEIDRNRQSNTLFLRDPQRVFSGVSFEHQSQAVDSLRWGTRAASFGVHKKRPWSWELFGGRGIPSPLNTSPELAPLLFLFFCFLHFLGPLWSTNQATSLDCLLGILIPAKENLPFAQGSRYLFLLFSPVGSKGNRSLLETWLFLFGGLSK